MGHPDLECPERHERHHLESVGLDVVNDRIPLRLGRRLLGVALLFCTSQR